jgi:HAD superfamily hydrolase (TIGR01509 family)
MDNKSSQDGALVILDCDGVLIDSEIIALRVEREELGRHGCTVSMDEYLELALGYTEEEQIWHEIAQRNRVNLPVQFAQQTRAKVAAAFENELRGIPGIEVALERLRHPYCIASGSRVERLDHTLRLTGLDRFFQSNIFSASMVRRGKPNPDLFIYAAKMMSARPRDCIVVEDSPAGVQAGVAAGMTVLGFTGASHCRPPLTQKLRDLGCNLVFDEMLQLPEICDQLINQKCPNNQ